MIIEAIITKILLPVTARALIDRLAEVESRSDYNPDRTFVRQEENYFLVFEAIDTLNEPATAPQIIPNPS